MGVPKADLPWCRGTILSELVRKYAALEAEKIVVVYGRHRPKALGLDIEQLSWVHNRNWQEGMRSSIRCGLIHSMTHEHAQTTFIHPVDCPGVHANTLTLLQTTQTKWAACPTYDDRPGHPVQISASLAKRLLLPDPIPLHEFINDDRTVFVPVNDSTILRNLNDMNSYQSCIDSDFTLVQMTDHVD